MVTIKDLGTKLVNRFTIRINLHPGLAFCICGSSSWMFLVHFHNSCTSKHIGLVVYLQKQISRGYTCRNYGQSSLVRCAKMLAILESAIERQWEILYIRLLGTELTYINCWFSSLSLLITEGSMDFS